MINIEQLKADRQAGTAGPWKIVRYDCGDGDIPDNTPMIDGPDDYDAAVVHWKGFKQKYWSSAHGDERAIEANARRIARLPDLEAAYLEAIGLLERWATGHDSALHPTREFLIKQKEKWNG